MHVRLSALDRTRNTSLRTEARHHLALLLSSAVVLGIVAGCSNTASQPMAKVGEKLVTAAQFEHALMLDKGGQLLLEMIDTELILSEAERRGVLARARSVQSKEEMRAFVQSLIK